MDSRLWQWTIALLASAMPFQVAVGQDMNLPTQQGLIERGSQNLGSLSNDLVGDRANLYNGTLEFVQTDASLPGNSGLPAVIGRRHVVGRNPQIVGQFGDWDLEIPHMYGVFASSTGWVNTGNGTNRCSTFTAPPAVQGGGTKWWSSFDYWQGNFLYIPGIGSQEVLRKSASLLSPSDGNTYTLTTQKLWMIRCLPTLLNGTGEGFLAVAPDGTKYSFNWMASRTVPRLVGPNLTGLARREVWLLPSQITDRFGNTVTFTYDPSAPMKLTRIDASDGRAITINYGTFSGNTRVSSVNDGTRTWTYQYSSLGDLDRVILPDASQWQFNLRGLFHTRQYEIGDVVTCTVLGGVPTNILTGSITHPSGAVATFQTQFQKHSLTNVSKLCINPSGIPGDPEYPRYPRTYITQTLIAKSITGPGIAPLNWSYTYQEPVGMFAPCTTCATSKAVLVTDPRNVVTRHTYGVRFRDNEGQLLQVDEGWNGSSALRTTTYRYRAPSGMPYPEPLGTSPSQTSDWMTHRLRPVDQRVTTQQGVTFFWQANSFDSLGRVTGVSRFNSLGVKSQDIIPG